MPNNNDDRVPGSPTAKRGGGMQSVFSVLQNYTLDDKGGRITKEFQDYGYRLAVELNDIGHKSLYMKMAKTTNRKVLEEARTFVLDANARSKARLFMWKVRELNNAAKSKTSGK